MDWKPFTFAELQQHLSPSSGWFLDGGYALDLLLGITTRPHHDIDIGVLSHQALALLSGLEDQGFTIQVANRELHPFDRHAFNPDHYNYWINDGRHFRLQVLVYPCDGHTVRFRRNPAIQWPASEITLSRQGVPIINPMVAYAFKVTTAEPKAKDLQDIEQLTTFMAMQFEDPL